MAALVKDQPGFIEFVSARDPVTRLGITVAYFTDEESVLKWKSNIEQFGFGVDLGDLHGDADYPVELCVDIRLRGIAYLPLLFSPGFVKIREPGDDLAQFLNIFRDLNRAGKLDTHVVPRWYYLALLLFGRVRRRRYVGLWAMNDCESLGSDKNRLPMCIGSRHVHNEFSVTAPIGIPSPSIPEHRHERRD
jgi:hypothetical protein